jgi:hypothetical protein
MRSRSLIACAALAVVGTLWAHPRARSQDASALPPPPAHLAVPESDPAGPVAREIARRVPGFPNLRATVPLGRWRVDARARWSIRPERECHAALRSQGIDFVAIRTRQTPIPSPVHVRGPIGGVTYRKMRHHAPFVVSCELASRLVNLSRLLARHGVHTVDVLSSWRTEPRTSFHTMGLAIDVHGLHTGDRELVVERDYAIDASRPTCPAPDGADELHRIACELGASGQFSTVITPSYNEGHRDHFHLDVRPDDPRVFVR